MSLIARIKADSIEARKSRSITSGLLVTLLGEINTKEKTFSPAREMTDAEIVAIVKKFINGVDETLTIIATSTGEKAEADRAKLSAEKLALELYMPRQLAEADIERIATERKAVGDDMGKIMAFLKAGHGGAYDGKMASMVVKRILA